MESNKTMSLEDLKEYLNNFFKTHDELSAIEPLINGIQQGVMKILDKDGKELS